MRVLHPRPIQKAEANGWQNVGERVDYEMGREFEPDFKHFCLEDSQDLIIQKQFEKNEALVKSDFKAKIRTLQQFYHKLNEKYNFNVKKIGTGGTKVQTAMKDFEASRRKSRKRTSCTANRGISQCVTSSSKECASSMFWMTSFRGNRKTASLKARSQRSQSSMS
jgi:activator of HSP90 ATPase